MNSKMKLLPLASLLALIGPAYSATVIAQYGFAGNSNDSSGNGFNGVDTDMTYVVDGVRGTVASFNGVSSSVNVGASGQRLTENANDGAGNAQFAMSMWIKPTAVNPAGGNDTNILMGHPSGGGVIEIVGQGSWGGMGGVNGSIGVNSGGGAGDVHNVPTIDVYDGNWHHIVIQWAETDLQSGNAQFPIELYIDNVLATDVNSNEYNGNGNGANLSLGGPAVWSNGGGADKYYTGLMSDVRFFDDQITSSEVNTLFTGVIPEPSSVSLLGLATVGVLLRRRRR